jgi:crossover junction endodeoxyribonuclease RuvC
MGHARGVILLVARRHGIRVDEFAANRIKQSLTGHGHASKQQMQRAIQGVWNLKSVPEPPDVADALAVALCCGRDVNGQIRNSKSEIRNKHK